MGAPGKNMLGTRVRMKTRQRSQNIVDENICSHCKPLDLQGETLGWGTRISNLDRQSQSLQSYH